MLDRCSESVLMTINSICSKGYKLMLDEDFSCCDKPVFEIINSLAENEYVSLKYCMRGEYLVKPTIKGKEYFYFKEQALLFKAILIRKSAVYAFIGSLLGGIIVATAVILIGLTYA